MKLGALKLFDKSDPPVESNYLIESGKRAVLDSELGGKPPFQITDVLTDDYKDVTTLGNWELFGLPLLGTFAGFKDYIHFQEVILATAQVKAADINANFDNLSPDEQIIVCRYLDTPAISWVNYSATITDRDLQQKYHWDFSVNDQAARETRMQAARMYIGYNLTDNNKMTVSDDLQTFGLITRYMEGIMSRAASNGNSGIVNYILDDTVGQTYYLLGLKPKNFNPIDTGLTFTDFRTNLAAIFSAGVY